MREFSVLEIETYATRAQASAAFATAINALESLNGLDIFSSEEQDSLKENLEEILAIARANDARIKVTEEALSRFQAVKPSQKALVALMDLMEGLKAEIADDGKEYVPVKSNGSGPMFTEDTGHRNQFGNHYSMDGEHAACGARPDGPQILVRDWKQVTCTVCLNLNQL
jgi:hypothetical protein